MVDWSNQSDSLLMQQVAAGSEAAFRALVERFSGPVLTLCRRILTSASDAEDVAAEVFVELWNRRTRYEIKRGSARTYILLITRSRCLDRLRSLANRPKGATGTDFRVEEHIVDRDLRPAEQAELADLIVVMNETLSALSQAQRTSLELAFYEGLSHREISDRLEMPLGTVKTHIRNGLQRLRRLLRTSTQGRRSK